MPAAPSSARIGNRPGPKPRLSRELVVETAVALGVDRVSIGAVAHCLGVAPGSLYRYIDSRDDLLAAALAAVFAAAPLPPDSSTWRAYLETEAWTYWALLRRYAGLVRRHEGRLVDVAMRRFAQLVEGLAERGFSAPDALLAADAVLDLMHDAAEQAARLRDPNDPTQVSEPMRAALTSYPPDLRAALSDVLADPEAHVRRKLGIVLDGIAARLAP